MNLKVLAEAGPTIGLGHFTRSLALVQMVSSIVNPVFFGLDESLVINTLNAHNISFQKLDSVDDFLNHITSEDIVLIDGYNYESSFQAAIRQKCHRLLVIDDEHDKQFHADLIINPAPGISEGDYEVSGNCNFLLGPKYALLRPSFLQSNRNTRSTIPSKALVCFGGADPDNLSHAVVSLLLAFTELMEIHLVVGPAYNYFSSLELLLNDNRLKVSRSLNETEMAEALKSAHFAIVPSSGILYECLGVGTPAISGFYIDNQSLMYKGWLDMGAIIGVENFNMELVKASVSDILNGNINFESLLKNIPVDGKSPERFQSIFKGIINSYEQ
tara:strand:- start:141 stop:1127 length:987 start_codon:yes stop_codon:yes gene_type:complete